MNPTLVLATLHQRLRSPIRMTLIGALWALPLIVIAATRGGVGIEPLNVGSVMALVLGAGLIGGDSSAGVLQLLFARPVTRAEYVLSRWLGVALGVVLLVVTQVGLGALIVTSNGGPLPASAVGMRMLAQCTNGLGSLSVLTMFSSLTPGIGDAIGVLVMQLSGGLMEAVGGLLRQPVLSRAGREIAGFAAPELPFQALAVGLPPSWFTIVSYFSTIALCLTVAILVMNRRELSYASD